MNDTIERTKKCLGQVLALNPSEIKDDAKLLSDLGAESLDLVELMFLLEREFTIQLSKKDVSLSAALGLSEEETHKNEVLTLKALSLLRERYPAASELLVDGVTRGRLAALITVQDIASAVDKKRSSNCT
jgi:acyl carrier protein